MKGLNNHDPSALTEVIALPILFCVHAFIFDLSLNNFYFHCSFLILHLSCYTCVDLVCCCLYTIHILINKNPSPLRNAIEPPYESINYTNEMKPAHIPLPLLSILATFLPSANLHLHYYND